MSDIFIPKHIYFDTKISSIEKIMLIEINRLSVDGECYEPNEYFAGFLGLSKERVSKIISSLKKKGYIEVTLVYEKGYSGGIRVITIKFK